MATTRDTAQHGPGSKNPKPKVSPITETLSVLLQAQRTSAPEHLQNCRFC